MSEPSKLSDAQTRHLRKGKAVVWSRSDHERRTRVFMTVAMEKGTLTGEINQDFLWSVQLDATSVFCILGETRLRDIDRYKLTPIIFTAASSTSQPLQSAFDAGADDFLEKPINPVIAAARLRGHLQRMTYLRAMERVRANLNRYVSTRTQQVAEDHAATGTLLEPEERAVQPSYASGSFHRRGI